MGGGVAGNLGAIAGAIVGSVIPFIGTVIGSSVGGLIAGAWGGAMACSLKAEKDKELARREVMAVIDRELSNILAQASSELNKVNFALRTKAEEAIRQIISQTRERLARQRTDLQKRRNADQKTLKEQSDRLEKQMKEFAQISSQLDSYGKEIS